MKAALHQVFWFATLTQALGFAKGVLIAYFFGLGAELDGYYLAQIVPASIAAIIQVAVQTGLLPAYLRLVSESAHSDASRLAGHVLLWLIVGCTAASVVLSLSAPFVVALLAPGASEAMTGAAVAASTVLAFLLLANVVADTLATLLNAHLRFAAAALAPAANAVVSGAVLLAVPSPGLDALVWGSLLGVFAQILIVAATARVNRIALVLDWRPTEASHAAIRSALAILPGAAFASISSAVPQLWAAQLPSGALSAYSYANRLHAVAAQVLAMSVSTVLLPHFARLLAEKRQAEIVAQLKRGLPIVLALGLIMAAWVLVAGEAALRLVFERGRFDARSTAEVVRIWFWLTVGLVPMVWGTVLAKVLQAEARSASLSAIAGAGLLTVAIACALLSRDLGVTGVALAVGAMYLVIAILCGAAVRRRLGLSRGTWPGRTALKVFGIAAAVTLSLYALDRVLSAHDLVLVLMASMTLAAGSTAVLWTGGHA